MSKEFWCTKCRTYHNPFGECAPRVEKPEKRDCFNSFNNGLHITTCKDFGESLCDECYRNQAIDICMAWHDQEMNTLREVNCINIKIQLENQNMELKRKHEAEKLTEEEILDVMTETAKTTSAYWNIAKAIVQAQKEKENGK